MLTVEDLVETLAYHMYGTNFETYVPDLWHRRFIQNVAAHTVDSKPVSTEQSRIILKLAGRCSGFLIKMGVEETALKTVLGFPSYRRPPYQSTNVPREVRYAGDNKLVFRFKFNDIIRAEIKGLSPPLYYISDDQAPMWRDEYRVWVISITRDNVERIMAFIKAHRFKFDDAVVAYLTLCVNSQGGETSFIYDAEANQFVVNVCDNEFLGNWVRNVLRAEVL